MYFASINVSKSSLSHISRKSFTSSMFPPLKKKVSSGIVFSSITNSLKTTLRSKSIPDGSALDLEKLNIKFCEIVVFFHSTHGESEFISCSEIDILNEKHEYVDVAKLELVDSSEDSTNLKRLINRDIMKDDVYECWTHPWSKTPIGIKFFIPWTYMPSKIRIWNCRNKHPSQVKDVEIYCDDALIVRREVPSNFGIDVAIPRVARAKSLLSMPSIVQKSPIPPVPQYTRLKITFIEPLDSKSRDFGFRCLQLYQLNSRKVPSDLIDTYRICDCEAHFDPKDIFELNTSENMFMFKAVDDANPVLEVVFREPIRLAFIRLFNVSSFVERGLSIKKLKVDWGNLTWIGTLKYQNPMSKNNRGQSHNTNDIMFIDRKLLPWYNLSIKDVKKECFVNDDNV